MRFMVEMAYTQAPTEEMLALIPAESARGLELDATGVRERLYLAANQSRAWQVLVADSQDEVKALVESFPLARFVSTTITPLADQ